MCVSISLSARADDLRTPLTVSLEGCAEAVHALSDGDPARAEIAARDALAAVPGGELAARAELALGLALRDQGRHGEAIVALTRAIPQQREEALSGVARFERAQALFYDGHPGAAAIEFAAIASHGTALLARRARWREADAMLEAGAPRAATIAYQALIAAEPTSTAVPGARLALARAFRASGEPDRAVALYRALWTDYPVDASGRAAGRALRAWRAEGGPVPPPTPDQRLARAARLLDLALPRRALAVLNRLDAEAPPPEPASRSLLLRGFAMLRLGRREEARDAALRIQRSPSAVAGTRTGAELLLARVAARSGRLDEAAERYRTISDAREPVPGLPPAQARDLPEEARFLAAWLYYDAGRYARAAELLRTYAQTHPSARRADDARWFEAWSLYRLGRREQARRALSRLRRGPLLPAALYWEARLGEGRDRQHELYRRVLREAPPGSWYALLAASHLPRDRRPASPPPAATPVPDGGASDPRDPLSRAAQLLGAGLRGAALAELRGMENRDVHARAALVAQLAAAAGDAELPFRMARDHLPTSGRALRWLYPLAFAEILPASANQAGCDPELYRAIMRRESAFRPDARSGAGAVGLVQLIPPTAERLAAVHGVAPGHVRQLEDPQVSIPLGASYLGLLSDRFVDPAVVLAAYNAGPVAAAAWARDRAGLPLDEWVEDIPFRETRRYVKNVLADAVVYRALWDGGELAVDGDRRVPAPREGVAF